MAKKLKKDAAKKPKKEYLKKDAAKKAKLENIFSDTIHNQSITEVLKQLYNKKFRIKIEPISLHTELGDIVGVFEDGIALRKSSNHYDGWIIGDSFTYILHRNGEMTVYSLEKLVCKYTKGYLKLMSPILQKGII